MSSSASNAVTRSLLSVSSPVCQTLGLTRSRSRARGRREGETKKLTSSFVSFTLACAFASAYENLDVQTHSNPAAFPSALRAKRALVVKAEDQEQENPNPIVRLRLPPFFPAPFRCSLTLFRCLFIVVVSYRSKRSARSVTRCVPFKSKQQQSGKAKTSSSPFFVPSLRFQIGLSYKDLQLRSVDEGSTTFYTVSAFSFSSLLSLVLGSSRKDETSSIRVELVLCFPSACLNR